MPDTTHLPSQFKDLYTKFSNNSCTSEEAEEILKLLEDPKNDACISEELKSRFLGNDGFSIENPRKHRNQTNMDHILDKLHHQIRLQEEDSVIKSDCKKSKWLLLAKAAAILLIPVVGLAVFLTYKTSEKQHQALAKVNWQSIKTPAGTQTDFILPDGSHVWLNSGSRLEYPVPFANNFRQVKLSGEAFFDVKKDTQHPFIVNAGQLNVEVKGTRFNVCNYSNEPNFELILESGSVRLFSGQYTDNKTVALITPGERALMEKNKNKMSVSKTDVEKYISWKDGLLIFRDDKMDDVVTKLNRKFNVEIALQGTEIKKYVYTATFGDESLSQILKLLKISAPIDYRIFNPKQLPDGTFSKQKIIFMKRK